MVRLENIWFVYTNNILFAAMKEAKALSVPSARYNEEDLPNTQLDYGAVSDKDIMTSSVNGFVSKTFVV